MATATNIVLEKFNRELDKWAETKMKHLVPGDIFRMWIYKNNEWVLHEYKEKTEFEADGNPYIHPEYNVWTINCKDFDDENNKDR